MNGLLDWGIPVIAWLQGLGDWLTGPMRFFTFLGQEEFYLLVMPAFLWCVDVGLGIRIGLLLLSSNGFNSFFKIAIGSPRPYWISNKVRALSAETSFGIPSGHAQNALAIWGRLAAWVAKRWAYVVLGLVIFLISVSRLQLGVHFPTDTLAGWLVGCFLLWAFLRLEEPVRKRLAKLSPWAVVGLGFLVSLSFILLGILARAIGPEVPTAWVEAAAAAAPGSDPIAPRSLDSVISSAGALFGLAAGGVVLFRWDGFESGGVWWKRVLRYVLGVAGVVVIYYGLRMVFPAGIQTLRYLRYAAVGFWIAFLAPRTFVALKLS